MTSSDEIGVIIEERCETAAPAAPSAFEAPMPDARERSAPVPLVRPSKREHELAIESVALRQGTLLRLQWPPHPLLRLPSDVADASSTDIFVLHVLEGAIDVEQSGRRHGARAGDVIALDGRAPALVSMCAPSRHDVVALALPAAYWGEPCRGGGPFGVLHLARDRVNGALAGCLRLLADHMKTAAADELSILHEAGAALFAAALKRLDAAPALTTLAAEDGPLLRRILNYTNRNIADHALAPPDVAQRFGISVRYLHKLFAASGATFGAYVAMRRLDQVRDELLAGHGEAQSIAALARKWGYRDLSTFNRAFRKRFGCAPRQLRSRIAS